MNDTYILNLSCADAAGIVAAVSGFLHKKGGFILESAQFGDFATDTFFMRCEFSIDADEEQFRTDFALNVATEFNMDWKLYNKEHKTKTLIMVSKFDHCLNDLLHRSLPMEVVGIVSNHEDFREAAGWHGIPFYHLPVTKDTKPEQEQMLLDIITETGTELVVLARYMQVLSQDLCAELSGRAINIHHSFLPSFKGAKPYHQAYDKGVKIIGATAHYVTSDLDEGPIIEQEIRRVDHAYKPEQLVEVGRDIESVVLARAVQYHLEHRVLLNGNKTVVF